MTCRPADPASLLRSGFRRRPGHANRTRFALSDAGHRGCHPLRYLIAIGEEEVLPALFGEVWAPGAVITELTTSSTPESVRRLVEDRPPWLHVRNPRQQHLLKWTQTSMPVSAPRAASRSSCVPISFCLTTRPDDGRPSLWAFGSREPLVCCALLRNANSLMYVLSSRDFERQGFTYRNP